MQMIGSSESLQQEYDMGDLLSYLDEDARSRCCRIPKAERFNAIPAAAYCLGNQLLQWRQKQELLSVLQCLRFHNQ